MDIREFLGKRHAIDVLLCVYQNPGIVQKQLANKSENGSTAKLERIREAVDLNLIREEKSSEHWSALVYYITDEGSRICKHLIAIEGGDYSEPMDCGSPSEEGNTVRE